MEVFYPAEPLHQFLRRPHLARPARRGRTGAPAKAAAPAPIRGEPPASSATPSSFATSPRPAAPPSRPSSPSGSTPSPCWPPALPMRSAIRSTPSPSISSSSSGNCAALPGGHPRRICRTRLRVAREEITRLDYIITQFLRAIRPTPLDTAIENLNTLVQESLAFLAPELKDRDILVETELRERPAAASARPPPDQAGLLQHHQERRAGDEIRRHPPHPHGPGRRSRLRHLRRTPAAAFPPRT